MQRAVVLPERSMTRIVPALVVALVVSACGAPGSSEDAAGEAVMTIETTADGPVSDEQEGEEEATADDLDPTADDPDEVAADADPPADTGDLPANGYVEVDGERYDLEVAQLQCPRETADGRADLTFNTVSLGPDMGFSIAAQEAVSHDDGSVAQRVATNGLDGVAMGADQIAEEGDSGYPLFEVTGDRLRLQVQLPGDGGTRQVVAEWDVPDAFTASC